jgi:uncharacterized repeat protein (TIGR03847 family)
LDEITQLAAIAVGVPGKRTFFLVLGRPGEWIRAWLEKELLEALALAVYRVLDSLRQEHLYISPKGKPEPEPEEVPAGLPSMELEIDQIALGYEQDRVKLSLSVHALGPQASDFSELFCLVTPARLKKLGDQAREICAAGRPRCPLCGGPIDPEGHVCPVIN